MWLYNKSDNKDNWNRFRCVFFLHISFSSLIVIFFSLVETSAIIIGKAMLVGNRKVKEPYKKHHPTKEWIIKWRRRRRRRNVEEIIRKEEEAEKYKKKSTKRKKSKTRRWKGGIDNKMSKKKKKNKRKKKKEEEDGGEKERWNWRKKLRE